MILLDNFLKWIVKEMATAKIQRKLLIIWLSGISLSIGIMESTYFNIDGYPASFQSWSQLPVFILIAGFIVGGISYYIKGFLLFIGIRLSGGAVTYRSSRRFLVYAGIPIYTAVIIIELANMVIYSNEYFITNTSNC